jgi:DNA-directed RNA polymerase subunit RPC12/RpoP
MISFVCQNCGKTLRHDKPLVTIRCPKCDQRAVVPAGDPQEVGTDSRQSSNVQTASEDPAMIRLRCPGCQGIFTVPACEPGQVTGCPECGQYIRIPSARFALNIPTASETVRSGAMASEPGPLAPAPTPSPQQPQSDLGAGSAFSEFPNDSEVEALGLPEPPPQEQSGRSSVIIAFAVVGGVACLLIGGMLLLAMNGGESEKDRSTSKALAVASTKKQEWERTYPGIDTRPPLGKQKVEGDPEIKVRPKPREEPKPKEEPGPIPLPADVKPVQVEKLPEDEKPDPKDKPRFDAKDMMRTMDWCREKEAELRKEQDNGLRLREAVKKLNTDLRSYRGTEVEWTFTVMAISESSVVLGTGTLPARGSVRSLELRIRHGISTERAAKLNKGDKIVVTAEITDAFVIEQPLEVYFNLGTLHAK